MCVACLSYAVYAGWTRIASCNIDDSVSSEAWEMAVFSCHFDMDRLVAVRF